MKGKSLTIVIVAVFLVVCGLVIYMASGDDDDDTTAAGTATAGAATAGPGAPTGPAVEILVSSSDGKKAWLEDVTKAFHESKAEVGGKPIRVTLNHMKSGASMQNILDGKEKPHLWSPAGRSWIDLINETWKTRHGKDFIAQSKGSVMSGLIVAMWEPMARALGWPDKQLGWDDIFKVAMDPKGWESYGHAEWGPFRYGHAHPDFSTSAMLSVISTVYAAAGKTSGLTPEDVKNPAVVERVGAMEQSIVHYGKSSSWLTEKLCTKGPAYLSGVTLYESSVVAANTKYRAQMPFKLVAVYPKEGTFWENHPSGVVQAEWVSDEQRQAAQKFLDFMTSKEQQAKAPTYGYRPADTSIPLRSPIDEEHGVDPKQSGEKSLAYVSKEVFQRVNELWHQVKKKSTVFVLLDVSGSMQGAKITAAKKGTAQFVRAMEKQDKVAVIAFSNEPKLVGDIALVRDVGEEMATKVEGLFAEGGTAMYDAALMAMETIEKAKKDDPNRLYGIVLLSDGKDTSSKRSMSDLMDLMPTTEKADGTRIFTVAYGKDADQDLLKKIADRSNAKFLKGNVDNIEKIYHEVSAYF